MKNILDLNIEIEKIVKPNIEYHQELQNIRYNGKWVNEIHWNYFNDWEERIKNKINNIADLDSLSKVKFIKVFHQDVLQKYRDLLKLDYKDLDILQSIPKTVYISNLETKLSKKKFQELYFSSDDFGYEETLTRMAEIYKIDDFDLYDAQHSPDSYKYILQDEILSNLKEDNEEKLESIYSYVHLSLTMEETRKMLGRITVYLDYLVNFIKKLENFEEDKLTLDEVHDNDPNNIKLEFKINKLAIAMFYRNLHDMGIINVDNKNQKMPYTNLKKYINDANIYYLDNKNVNKVDRINKEFSKILNDKYKEYKQQELNLLDLLISKFQEKKEQILSQ
ncbi:hypothetical protein [Gaetbulibacter saemankumensis]|uniref:hypothetical protein n=1 Tax=Gaetbulibacter saemankumensis TaxID=311208 RepID=UPI00040DDA8B|nr:hypothetical protein [Gaetbulibacter saemankumensis]